MNLAEAIKCGAVWYRVSRNESDLNNTAIALDHLTRIAGSPSGAFIAGAWPRLHVGLLASSCLTAGAGCAR